MKNMRIGLLGGTFDPPHLGHIRLAEIAVDALRLDQVRFMPNAIPPHKDVAFDEKDGFARIRLIQEAIAHTDDRFAIERMEVARGGVSFTVDTLEHLHIREPDGHWVFIMGSDQLCNFTNWRHAKRILELASLAVAVRDGQSKFSVPDMLLGRLKPKWSGKSGEVIMLPGTKLKIASSELRQDIRLNRIPQGIAYGVLATILREKRYR